MPEFNVSVHCEQSWKEHVGFIRYQCRKQVISGESYPSFVSSSLIGLDKVCFYQLQLSTEQLGWVSINAPGWWSVNQTHVIRRNSATLIENWAILTPSICVISASHYRPRREGEHPPSG